MAMPLYTHRPSMRSLASLADLTSDHGRFPMLWLAHMCFDHSGEIIARSSIGARLVACDKRSARAQASLIGMAGCEKKLARCSSRDWARVSATDGAPLLGAAAGTASPLCLAEAPGRGRGEAPRIPAGEASGTAGKL